MANFRSKGHRGLSKDREENISSYGSDSFKAAQRAKIGKIIRERVPRTDHASWEPSSKRPYPIDVLLDTEKDRSTELLPIRHGRMAQSPLNYLRGAGAMMAYDLSTTPSTGIHVQAGGDCHLANFGFTATPEGNLVFDIDDFDETIPAPWEWDLKRLATSLYVSGMDSRLSERNCQELAVICSKNYREFMRALAKMKVMQMWFCQPNLHMCLSISKAQGSQKAMENAKKTAKCRLALRSYPKITNVIDGHRKIIDQPPLVFHQKEGNAWPDILEMFSKYRHSLGVSPRILFDRYHFEDFATKVVGIGSVGTQCGLGLFLAEPDDPLFLQIKEATHSVYEPYVAKSEYPHQGQRVVEGQRIIQADSDIMLGWVTINERHYYIRQTRNINYLFNHVQANFELLSRYARICGMALAKAHARSGDAAMIAGYLGKGEVFDKSLASFAHQYAKQNLTDYEALLEAIRTGRIEAVEEKSVPT